VSLGKKALNFSAKYNKIAPDSKTRVGGLVLLSIKAGMFELGLISTNSVPN
jgi:hypothetical protein